MVLAALAPHSVFVLLLQLALLLVVARAGALLSRLLGLPAVVGELAAGIVLGPSVLGHYAPHAFELIFPRDAAQMNLLEVVGTLGMVLLLLLTGLETDLRLLRNLGRAALVASAMGMLVPFAMGYGLGMLMPETYLAQPDRRVLFSAFLATAMAISAMPVIAKILMDLDLTRRNVGLVILSAGVVDDTAGWLILSVIAGAATQGGAVKLGGLALTVLLMSAFLLGMAILFYPLMRVVMRLVTRLESADTDLVLIVATTLVCAALTESIGIHAVFGAFVCGTVLRQLPDLEQETVHRLESFVFSILAPVFFGIVGLKVDLWTLAGAGGGQMLGIVLAIACLGKLVGCTIGSLWGGLQFWEALSIAVAMNARGAMELVVASIGLSLGILNQQMFSIIVVVAISTSFMAPLALRLTMRQVKMTDEEARRLLVEASKGVFDPARLRVLIPTAAGPNAIEAARIGLALSKSSESAPSVLFIDAKAPWYRRLFRRSAAKQAGHNLDQHLQQIRALTDGGTAPRMRTVVNRSVPGAILEAARQGVDLVMIGASGRGAALGGTILEEVVVGAPCHVAIVRSGTTAGKRYQSVMVPIDGSTVARVAAELALRYAESSGAQLTLALLTERRPIIVAEHDDRPSMFDPGRDRLSVTGRMLRDETGAWQAARAAAKDDAPRPSRLPIHDETGAWPAARIPAGDAIAPASDRFGDGSDEELFRISPAFRASDVKPRVLRFAYDPRHSALVDEIARGGYDLVVLGAENRAIQHKMFFGYEAQRIISRTAVSLVVVVPNVGRLPRALSS